MLRDCQRMITNRSFTNGKSINLPRVPVQVLVISLEDSTDDSIVCPMTT